MCDQFFGCFAQPGGGLFTLEKPFGAEPAQRDLLAGATVSQGRLQGQKLAGGSFLSPTLSYDARTLLFAYTEGGLSTSYPAPGRGFATPSGARSSRTTSSASAWTVPA